MSSILGRMRSLVVALFALGLVFAMAMPALAAGEDVKSAAAEKDQKDKKDEPSPQECNLDASFNTLEDIHASEGAAALIVAAAEASAAAAQAAADADSAKDPKQLAPADPKAKPADDQKTAPKVEWRRSD